VIAVDQVRRWAAVRPGQNLLALDLARVKRDLELVSLVKTASIERILPRTLRICITEREPLAQCNIPRPRPGGGVELVLFQIDADGYVIAPLSKQQRSAPATQAEEQLPMLTGLNPVEVQAGRRIESPQARAALRLLTAFERSPMEVLVDIQRIDVSAADVLVATTTQGSEVTFALADMDQQLLRWHEIFDMGQKLSRAIATLDLAVTNHIPARWLEASAVPTGTPKLPRNLHPRKKHV
jgi:cell division septal protein FtsQ